MTTPRPAVFCLLLLLVAAAGCVPPASPHIEVRTPETADQTITIPRRAPQLGQVWSTDAGLEARTGDGTLRLRVGTAAVAVTQRGVELTLPSLTAADPPAWSSWTSTGTSLTHSAAGLSESWTMDHHALWHRFELASAEVPLPALRFGGHALTVTDHRVDVETAFGVWRYDGLAAWDARGNDLDAQFSLDGDVVRVQFHREPEAWPVTVDPWLTGPDQGDPYDAFFILGTGDVNGDGYDDALFHTDGNGPDWGIYYGSPTGLDLAAPWISSAEQPPGGLMNFGDINGDGIGDLVLASSFGDNRTQVWEGRTTRGLSPSFYYSDGNGAYGYNIAGEPGVGDFDGNGYQDVVRAGRWETQYTPNQLYRHVAFHGGPAYRDQVVQSTLVEPVVYPPYFGDFDHTSGDVNGDGYDDMFVSYALFYTADLDSYPCEGFLWSGSPNGLIPDWTWTTRTYWPELGDWMRKGIIAGDLNGDGFDDLVLAGHRGTLWWARGGPNGPGEPVAFGAGAGACWWTDFYDPNHPELGCFWPKVHIDRLGDINGDGYADLIVGAQDGTNIHLGSPYGPMTNPAVEYRWVAFGVAPVSRAMGDVNGDGYDDFAASAQIRAPAEGAAISVWFGAPTPDPDGDGFLPPEDCNPWVFTAHPGGTETPGNPWDEDCDGQMACYLDLDGDGQPGGAWTLLPHTEGGCEAVGGWTEITDCDDASTAIGPHVIDLPDNHIDEDCNNRYACHVDRDGDGYGTPAPALDITQPCHVAPEASPVGADCDDSRADVNPGMVDLAASGADEDCDGVLICGTDQDGDGYGAADVVIASPDQTCEHPGMFDVLDDCNDFDAGQNPSVPDIVGDDIDQNCNGYIACYRDNDGDGYGSELYSPRGSSCDAVYFGNQARRIGGDCNDYQPSIHPGATEVPNQFDDNCDGTVLCGHDLDGDGAGNEGYPADSFVRADCTFEPGFENGLYGIRGGDCDDTDPSISPLVPEVADELDNNCDEIWLCGIDLDGDGYGTSTVAFAPGCTADHVFLLGECDDADPGRSPGNPEIPGNEVDENCDNRKECYVDRDGDGYGGSETAVTASSCTAGPDNLRAKGGDCRDDLPEANPEMMDGAVDGRDANCDGVDGIWVEATVNNRLIEAQIHGLGRGNRVILTLSRVGAGAGPCLRRLRGECSGLLSPLVVADIRRASKTGDATWTSVVPPYVPDGSTLWLQAWLEGTPYLSPVVEVGVTP